MTAPVPLLDTTEARIKRTRDEMHEAGQRSCNSRVHETVFFTRILDPMLKHGSAGIYAPDVSVIKACQWVRENLSWSALPSRGEVRAVVQRNICFLLFVVAAVICFKLKGQQLTCLFKESFLTWALANRGMRPWARYVSISGIMIVRLFVSNVFPFTSPAFAFLIGLSQPPGEEWMGTLFLLGCSMPAGALIPFLDWLLYWIIPRFGATGSEGSRYDHHFRATRLLAAVTDHLPFSFWVRSLMERTFTGMSDGLHTEQRSAAAGAVLMGHFMVWAGPATTMYQRLFVPDVVTCILIQPLGLLEDVAVTLAAWAAAAHHEKNAELALYFFMMYMNLVHLSGLYMEDMQSKYMEDVRFGGRRGERRETGGQEGEQAQRALFEHSVTFFLTLCAALIRSSHSGVPGMLFEYFHKADTTTMTTTAQFADANACKAPTLHPTMMLSALLLGWVSFLAVLFHSLARCLSQNLEHLFKYSHRARFMNLLTAVVLCLVLSSSFMT